MSDKTLEEVSSELREERSAYIMAHGVFVTETRRLREEVEALKAKLGTANALVTCCCGSPVDSHGMGDGHSPVDMYHYRLMQMENDLSRLRNIEEAANRLAYVVRRSVNAGPNSNDPTSEGQAWRALRLALGESYDEKGNLVVKGRP